eukprot:5786103-Pyramimonas_sp.AAC.1
MTRPAEAAALVQMATDGNKQTPSNASTLRLPWSSSGGIWDTPKITNGKPTAHHLPHVSEDGQILLRQALRMVKVQIDPQNA